jgi:hypothetical protein
MRKIFYVAFCSAGMIGFFLFMRLMITGISPQFGYGFGAGIFVFFAILWCGEKLGAFKVVELNKGTWIPNIRDD